MSLSTEELQGVGENMLEPCSWLGEARENLWKKACGDNSEHCGSERRSKVPQSGKRRGDAKAGCAGAQPASYSFSSL